MCRRWSCKVRALGAYQAGVYQALSWGGIEATGFAACRSGAINSAIMAGNPPEAASREASDLLGAHHARKVWHLHAGWRRLPQGPQSREFVHDDDAGQPRLLQAHDLNPCSVPRRETATAITIPAVCARPAGVGGFRPDQCTQNPLAVGAVTSDRQFLYSTTKRSNRTEHVMASGALPPALPMVKIGKITSGTAASSPSPLQHLLTRTTR